MVKIYALSTCPWCKKLRQHLDDRGISYQCIEVDMLDKVAQQEALAEVSRLAGERVFPVTVVGSETVVGYRPERIMEALADEA